jgi:uncharacterized protein YggE
MTDESTTFENDEDEKERQDALAAMKRARLRAEKIAAETGTALIQSVDGKPVRVPPPRAEDSGRGG